MLQITDFIFKYGRWLANICYRIGIYVFRLSAAPASVLNTINIYITETIVLSNVFKIFLIQLRFVLI